MNGTVVLVNPKNGFFVIEIDAGDYTVCELLGNYAIEVGDHISGNLHSHGREDLLNRTQRENMIVFIQGIHCSASAARAMAHP